MTTSTFIPKSSTQFVNWSDPTVWSGGIVPNDPSVDVVIPTATTVSTGQTYVSFINEDGNYTVRSLVIANNDLLLNKTLTVLNALTVSTGGEIDLGFDGSAAGGTLSVGSLVNQGQIQRHGSISSS